MRYAETGTIIAVSYTHLDVYKRQIPGVSGDEREVRRFIRAALPKRGVTLQTDAMGNLLVHKGTGRPMSRVPRIMLSAHMDEVGLMISSIEKTGHLRFRKIGGIDDRVLVSRTVVVGRDKIPGVIGAKAIHLQKAEERKKSLEIEQLFIDIGVRNKEAVSYTHLDVYKRQGQ